MENGATIQWTDGEIIARWESDGKVYAENPLYADLAVTYLDNLDCVGMYDIHSQNFQHCPKMFRCHTRKRFVKIMMSAGYSKRIAQFISTFAESSNKVCKRLHPEKDEYVTLQSLLFYYISQSIRVVYDGGVDNGNNT